MSSGPAACAGLNTPQQESSQQCPIPTPSPLSTPQGSLDELSQALVSGGASSLRSASLPEGLTLPTLPSWRSTCSTPAGASHGWGGGSGSSAASSAAASPMFRACTLPEEARQEPALDAMDEGA